MAGTCPAAADQLRTHYQPKYLMTNFFTKAALSITLVLAFAGMARAERFSREFKFDIGGTVEIVNRFGRVNITATKNPEVTATDARGVLAEVVGLSFSRDCPACGGP